MTNICVRYWAGRVEINQIPAGDRGAGWNQPPSSRLLANAGMGRTAMRGSRAEYLKRANESIDLAESAAPDEAVLLCDIAEIWLQLAELARGRGSTTPRSSPGTGTALH